MKKDNFILIVIYEDEYGWDIMYTISWMAGETVFAMKSKQ